MHMLIRNAPGLSLCTLLLCCADRGPPEHEPIVRDSAGIRIVENTATPAVAGDWSLDVIPLVDIGAVEDDPMYELFQVRAAARLGDGRIVVASLGTKDLRFYDSTGTFLDAVGRDGEGPGEFRSVGALWRIGEDSLAVIDARLGRVTVLSTGGGLGRIVSGLWPFGLLPDGTFLGRVTPPDVALPTGVGRIDVQVQRFDATGTPIDTLGTHVGDEGTWQRHPRYGVLRAMRPFERTTQFAVLGNQYVVADNQTYELRLYDLDSDLRTIIRKQHPIQPVAPEDVDAFVEGMIGSEGAEDLERIKAQYREALLPADLPAYDEVRIDATGRIWVSESVRPGDEVPRWSVFDSSGVLLASALFPPRLQLLDAGDEYVLGLWRDSLDVEHVRLYRLIQP